MRRIEPSGRMSQAVVHNGFVFLAGQVDRTLGATVADQTRSVLASIDRLLREVGTDKSLLVSATIWLSDIATFAQMNDVWDAWVDSAAPPARATVEARLANPAYKVEIAVVAALPTQDA